VRRRDEKQHFTPCKPGDKGKGRRSTWSNKQFTFKRQRSGGKASFLGLQAVQSPRVVTQKGPTLGLMLCCHPLEVLNNLSIRGSVHIALGPANYIADTGGKRWWVIKQVLVGLK